MQNSSSNTSECSKNGRNEDASEHWQAPKGIPDFHQEKLLGDLAKKLPPTPSSKPKPYSPQTLKPIENEQAFMNFHGQGLRGRSGSGSACSQQSLVWDMKLDKGAKAVLCGL